MARQVRPPFVIWNFTNICSLKCKHCYQNAGDELSFAEKMTLIDSLVDAGVKVPCYLVASHSSTPTSGPS